MIGKRKRSLSLEPQQHESLRQVLLEQIDLEMALKGRLLAAAKARVEWADILKNGLTCDPKPPTDASSTSTFRDAALAAYEAIESSCLIITSSKSRLLAPLTTGRPPPSAPPPPIEAPRTRKRVNLGLAQAPSINGPLLFEDKATSTTVKLVCPDCSRVDFPTMQGFINHCRLGHDKTHNTHDECIQATGIPISEAERAALVATGVEISTVSLPSLRGMFQRAVGLGLLPQNGTGLVPDESGISTHLSQTLGLHKDSPMLAPFLGMEVKKKVIRVYDEPQPVDILATDIESEERRKLKLKRYKPKKTGGEEECLNAITIAATERASQTNVPSSLPSKVQDPQQSRFHVSRRVTVSDRSLYLPESKRSPTAPSHTHRWQLAVSAPSYSQHITTFLDRFTVSCVTHPSVFTRPILVSGPPFIACSTTDKPFLARLTLHWVGDKNHPFEVDHWVELDQVKSSRVLLGEEQVFDVELDRNTQFAPMRDIANTLPWNGDGDYHYSAVEEVHTPIVGLTDIGVVQQGEPDTQLQHIKLLKKIAPLFPMVMQEGVRLSSLPYPAQPSRSKLLNLIPGRRKAIEWACALAVRKEYDSIQESSSDPKVPLTTAGIYRWLDINGHFPRPPLPVFPVRTEHSISPTGTPDDVPARPPRYCPVCGINVLFHNPPGSRGVNYYRQTTEPNGTYQCPPELERRRAPVLHVYTLLAGVPYWNSKTGMPIVSKTDYGHYVHLANPQLTRFVRREMASMPLSCRPSPLKSDRESRVDQESELSLGKNGEEVNESLAPQALLALVVERVVKDLINNGVVAAREMQGRTKANILETSLKEPQQSVLTPTHIFQSLVIKDASQGGGKREVLSKCFSRVGTVLQMDGAAASASTTQGGTSIPRT